jgi:hypothetical protein
VVHISQGKRHLTSANLHQMIKKKIVQVEYIEVYIKIFWVELMLHLNLEIGKIPWNDIHVIYIYTVGYNYIGMQGFKDFIKALIIYPVENISLILGSHHCLWLSTYGF